MRFASLGSGSEGNGLVVQANQSTLLLDCGFGLADTVARLARLQLTPGDVQAIVVTHEHDDHVGGVARFARKYNIPVYLTYGTMTASGLDACDGVVTHIIDSHTPFSLGDIEVRPFPVPHDAREPAQFVFTDGNHLLGMLTDTGASTSHIECMLSGLHALVMECNHDLEMLMNGSYPQTLKQRIAGRLGHLDNASSARIMSAIDGSRLQHVVA